MLVVTAFEARGEKDTAFDTDIFNNSDMYLIARQRTHAKRAAAPGPVTSVWEM